MYIKDSGFIPEAELSDRSGKKPIYDYMREENVPLEEIIEAANKATLPAEDDIPTLKSYLQSEDSAIRYWGATGLLILGGKAQSASQELKLALNDPSSNVVVVASEALYNLGDKTAGRSGFERVLTASNSFARTHALNAIDSVGDDSEQIKNAVITMSRKAKELTRQHYDHRAAKVLLDKWGIDPTEHGIKVAW